MLLPDMGGARVTGWKRQGAEGTRLHLGPVNRRRRDSGAVGVPEVERRRLLVRVSVVT